MSQQSNKTEIGGWEAQRQGLEFGKHIEYRIYQIPTSKGGVFTAFELFKPYLSKKPEDIQRGDTYKRGFSFPFPNGIKEVIERINHMIMMYAPEKGLYVFHPQPMGQPMGPYASAPAVPQGPGPGMAAPQPQQQGYAQPQPAAQPVQGYPPQQPQQATGAPQGYPPNPGTPRW